MSGLDWPGLLRAGLYGLRLTPDQFWRLTPAELAIMLGANGAQGPLRRSGLEGLMSAYPDQVKGDTCDERAGSDRQP